MHVECEHFEESNSKIQLANVAPSGRLQYTYELSKAFLQMFRFTFI